MLRLAVCFLLFPLPAENEGSTLISEARFLQKSDLPDDFRFPVLELDFAVLEIGLKNETDQQRVFDPELLQVLDPKGKALERAAPTEITPKIMKSPQFRRSSRNIHGDVGIGRTYGGVYFPPTAPVPGPGGRSDGKVISAQTATLVREVLERHEARQMILPPGERGSVLLYFKSKKSARELAGSVLLENGVERLKIE